MEAPDATVMSVDDPEIKSFTIIGQTREGRRFRPSDWAERLCGVMSAFGADHRTKYSPYVRPGMTEEHLPRVYVNRELYEIEPLAYNFLVSFAKDNDLEVREGECFSLKENNAS